MTARDYPVFTVTPKAERSLKAGHPWVYGEEVTAVGGVYQNGDMVDVVSSKGRYLGSGWVNDHSKIRVRVISRNANDTFDEAFFRRRVRYALDYRKTVMGPIDYRCCRLIFGEADQFPGLTVDRFENVLVTQVLSLGMERRKDMVYRALVELLREDGETIDAIYERNDVAIRALELAAENGRRNGLTNLDYKCADVFDLLTEMAREKKCGYDYIILDPPAFTKSRATAKNAYHGYKEINRKAMRLLPRGGYLATCSCSHFMTDEMFRRMLQEAALDAGVTLRQIEARQQAPDHPILPGVPETDYLKFYLLQVV